MAKNFIGLLMIGISVPYLVTSGDINTYFHSKAEYMQKNHLCGREIWQVKYKYAPPFDSMPDDSVSSVGVSKTEGSHLLVTAYFGRRVKNLYGLEDGYFTSDDGGNTWRLLEPFEKDRLTQSLRLFPKNYRDAPSDENIKYKSSVIEKAGAKYSRVIFERSDDGGRTWQQLQTLAEGLPVRFIGPYVIHPQNPFIIYCNADVYKGVSHKKYTSGFYISEDGGTTFRLLHKEIGRNRLAISLTNPTILYANGPQSKLMKSTDGGKTWNPAGQSEELRTAYVLENGMAEGPESQTSKILLNHYEDIIIDPLVSDIVYVQSEKGLFKTIDGGEHWRILDLGIENAHAFNNLRLDPHNHNTLYAGTRYGLFKSTDQGCTWEKIEIHKRLIR